MEIIVILDNIRSAFNVGSVFRTSDGAGVKKLYLCGITPGGDHIKVKKTALGAEEFLAWEHEKDILKVMKNLKSQGFTLISVEQAEDSQDYKKIDYPEKVAFIFGNEISGVSSEVIENSDIIAEVPMKGKKNSLNVSTTVGIVLYNLVN